MSKRCTQIDKIKACNKVSDYNMDGNGDKWTQLVIKCLMLLNIMLSQYMNNIDDCYSE